MIIFSRGNLEMTYDDTGNKMLESFYVDIVYLPQGLKATTRRHYTF